MGALHGDQILYFTMKDEDEGTQCNGRVNFFDEEFPEETKFEGYSYNVRARTMVKLTVERLKWDVNNLPEEIRPHGRR